MPSNCYLIFILKKGTVLAELLSFDIDGTMEFGDPPGGVTVEMVRGAKAAGYIVGSCSDRPVSNQKDLWQRNELEVSFTVLKHELDSVKAEFEAETYTHIGDTEQIAELLTIRFADGFNELWTRDLHHIHISWWLSLQPVRRSITSRKKSIPVGYPSAKEKRRVLSRF